MAEFTGERIIPGQVDPDLLNESVRQALGRAICRQPQTDQGDLPTNNRAPSLEERLMQVFAGLREAVMRADDDIAALVAAFVRGIGDTVERHPWLPSLWVREVLCEGGALRELMLARVGPQLPTMLAGAFAQAQRAGHIDPRLDPRLLVVSLVGLTLFPAAGAPIWRSFFDADDLDADAMRDHTIALLDGGLGLATAGKDPA